MDPYAARINASYIGERRELLRSLRIYEVKDAAKRYPVIKMDDSRYMEIFRLQKLQTIAMKNELNRVRWNF